MEIGMSLGCFYPMEPELAVEQVASLGFQVCEVFLNTYSEMDPAYIHSLRESCDRYGLRVYSIHPFTSFLENYMFFSPYPRRIEDSTALYRRYAEVAKILGAEVINIHGDRGMGLENPERYVDLLAPLLKLQDETGIIYSMENVFFNSVNHPEFTAKIRQLAPDVRFTLDIKQAFKGGQDPYALAEAMGSAIVNFHVNDQDPDNLCLLPGRGTVDYEAIRDTLNKNGYAGPGILEVYRYCFDDPRDIIPSKSFLEKKFSLAK